MRDNLVYYGVPENTEQENCESLVKELIRIHLGLDVDNMIFDRAHRMGNRTARQPRPIVVKFHKYKDREEVRVKSLENEIKSKLRDQRLGIGIQSPQEHRDARKAFYAISKQEQDRGNRTRIVGNKLLINNVIKYKYVDGNVCDYTSE